MPVGTVEFIQEYLKRWYYIDGIKPLNIPKELMKAEYLKRWTLSSNTVNRSLFIDDKYIFVKDLERIKGFTSVIEPAKDLPNEELSNGEFLISEYVDIESEWRAFVFNNELVGLQCYSGDFTNFPDVELIKQMIKDFDYRTAYTLDVGINGKGTFVIECHDFISCGLYGYADYKLLPNMFISAWNKLITR